MAVAGDTSSGKSSVLERLTGISFPSGEGIVTRFATEVAMRPADVAQIRVTIIPGSNRSPSKARELRRFRRTLGSLSDYQDVHDQAAEAMGLSDGQTSLLRDVLRVEVRGPHCVPLTVIDLPGLIQATSATVTVDDMRASHQIVEEYLQNPRTIILAVVSALNDVLNQAITQKARDHDPDGSRTMGILTKVDAVSNVAQREKQWLDLAQNKNVVLQLGWHVLVNKIEEEPNASQERIDAQEVDFFEAYLYPGELDPETVGMPALRTRIAKVLHDGLISALPELQLQFESKLQSAQARLERLGSTRSDTKSQRLFVGNICSAFHMNATAAVAGNYSDPFFRVEGITCRKLRAEIERLNLDHAKSMRLYGASLRIDGSTNVDNVVPNPVKAEERKRTYAHWSSKGKTLNRMEAVEWVLRELESSRGSERPGSVNPQPVGHLFWQLSALWETLTKEHLRQVQTVCNKLMVSCFWTWLQQTLWRFARRFTAIASSPKWPKLRTMQMSALPTLLLTSGAILAPTTRHTSSSFKKLGT